VSENATLSIRFSRTVVGKKIKKFFLAHLVSGSLVKLGLSVRMSLMSQETANKSSEGTSRKRTREQWIHLGCVGVLCVLCILMSLKDAGPLRPIPLEGIVVILDENGEKIPFRETKFTFYSDYPPNFFRSERSRKLNYHIDQETGKFGGGYVSIPKCGSTLFFHTINGKYVAVVDIAKGEPTTGLVIELRPRYSATGRLVDRNGTPLAHYEFSLMFERSPDLLSGTFFDRNSASGETFEALYCETDAEGYFTVDRLIPGLGYGIRFHQPKSPKNTWYSVEKVLAPILQPEQYQQPYSLGDVVVRFHSSIPVGPGGLHKMVEIDNPN
jgi:hypothetical protein